MSYACHGLRNLGNTCYFNAALQCLLAAPPLTNYLLRGLQEQDQHVKRVNACGFLAAYNELARCYWLPGGEAPDPAPAKAAFNKLHKRFANGLQHDAHEALLLALKALHDSLAKTQPIPGSHAERALARMPEALAAWHAHNLGNYSIISEIFQGQSRVTLTGTAPGGAAWSSTTHEHWLDLCMAIPEDCGTLQRCLAAHLAPEAIPGYKHEQHGTVTATRSVHFTYLPLVLVVTLKRFAHGGRGAVKTDRLVDYSMDLELQDTRYKLFAMCLHSGMSTEGGHYTAMCNTHGQWWFLDDASASEVDDLNALIRKEAYMLLFKKAA